MGGNSLYWGGLEVILGGALMLWEGSLWGGHWVRFIVGGSVFGGVPMGGSVWGGLRWGGLNVMGGPDIIQGKEAFYYIRGGS